MTREPSRRPVEASEDAWEGLTMGTLTRDEEAVLRALAEEDAADAARLQAHAPLDEAFRARVTERLGESLAANKKKRARRALLGGAGLSMAAAAALLLLWMPRESTTLPPYTLNVQGTDAPTRGDRAASDERRAGQSPAVQRIAQDGVLTLIARPQRRVQADVSGYLFALKKDKAEPIEARSEAAESGAIRVQVPAATLGFVGKEPLMLVLVVSHERISASEARQLVATGDPSALITHVGLSER